MVGRLQTGYRANAGDIADAFAATKIASLIFRPERLLMILTFLPKPKASKFEFRKLFFDLPTQAILIAFSRTLAPSGNIQSPSRFRLTSSTRPRFAATSFEDFAISYKHHLSTQPDDFSVLILNPVQNTTKAASVGGPFNFPSTVFSAIAPSINRRVGDQLPACQMVLDAIGDLLADRRQLKQVFFDDRIVRLLGTFPIRGRLAPKTFWPIMHAEHSTVEFGVTIRSGAFTRTPNA
jgi:hypothetical protein